MAYTDNSRLGLPEPTLQLPPAFKAILAILCILGISAYFIDRKYKERTAEDNARATAKKLADRQTGWQVTFKQVYSHPQHDDGPPKTHRHLIINLSAAAPTAPTIFISGTEYSLDICEGNSLWEQWLLASPIITFKDHDGAIFNYNSYAKDNFADWLYPQNVTVLQNSTHELLPEIQKYEQRTSSGSTFP